MITSLKATNCEKILHLPHPVPVFRGRSKTEYDPPEANLGPAWMDHGKQLEDLPEVSGLVKQCFLHQKVEPARITAQALLEAFRAEKK